MTEQIIFLTKSCLFAIMYHNLFVLVCFVFNLGFKELEIIFLFVVRVLCVCVCVFSFPFVFREIAVAP